MIWRGVLVLVKNKSGPGSGPGVTSLAPGGNLIVPHVEYLWSSRSSALVFLAPGMPSDALAPGNPYTSRL
jgi:hypothetical protein